MRSILRLALLIALIYTFESSYCQSSSIFDVLEYSSSSEGKVRVIQDDAIKTLVEKHQWNKSKQKGIKGYRIRIFSNSGSLAKDGYDKAMANFAYYYENIPIYQEFDYPFYKIYVGDFRTESEALKFRIEVEKRFRGAFISPPINIYFPKLELNE